MIDRLSLLTFAVLASGGMSATTYLVPTLSGGGIVIKKPKEEWQWPKDFKDNCWGNFLTDRSKGQVIVCKDKTKQSDSKPSFYLWLNDSNKHTEISQLRAEGLNNNSWTVTFIPKDEISLGSNKLTISKEQANNLDQINNQDLRGICVIEYRSQYGLDYLTCKKSQQDNILQNTTLNVTLKKQFLF